MIKKIVFLLIVPLIFIWGCSSNGNDVNDIDSVVYLLNSDFQEIEISESNTSYQLWISKGGYNNSSISVSAAIDKEALDEYNAKEGTDFILLPKECYTISGSATVSNDQRSDKIDIIFDGKKISDNENYILPITIYCDNPEWLNENKKTVLLNINSLFGYLKIASYNIKYDDDSTEDPWLSRKLLVQKVFDNYNFDIVGVQEPYKYQIDDIKELVPQYEYLGTGDTGSVPVFYKKDRFEVIESNIFWLSDTPDQQSVGWDASKQRKCRWVLFKDKLENIEFYFFNTHLDHKGTKARTESVKLLISRIPEIAKDHPAILVGDFNLNQNDANYKVLISSGILTDSYTIASINKNKDKRTFNGYNINSTSKDRIDHAFLYNTSLMKIYSHEIITDSFDGKFPSDHNPIMILAKIKY